MADAVEIIEVSPRDGLQNEPETQPTAMKVELIRRAVAAGVRRIEVASFVHPKRVPQMADAEAVAAALGPTPGVTRIGLVLNDRGAERALAAGVDELGAVCAASDGFATRNQGQTSDETVETCIAILEKARAAGRSAQVTISTVFGCPFDGEVAPARVGAIVGRLAEAGPREIALADTIGAAAPPQVRAVLTQARAAAPQTPLRLHFHNTRNTALANAFAGYEAGVRRFDGSIGGVGGCPFAPAATGNVPTEDVVYMFERAGVATGLDLDGLIATARWLSEVMGRPLPGMTSRAGPFPRIVHDAVASAAG